MQFLEDHVTQTCSYRDDQLFRSGWVNAGNNLQTKMLNYVEASLRRLCQSNKLAHLRIPWIKGTMRHITNEGGLHQDFC